MRSFEDKANINSGASSTIGMAGIKSTPLTSRLKISASNLEMGG